MEIQEYVQKVLTEISKAIDTCNKRQTASTSFTVNPDIKNAEFYEGQMYVVRSDMARTQIVNVDFDIAVTSSKTAGGGGKVVFSVLGIGGEYKNKRSSVNRVRFSLPVLFQSSLQE